MPDISTYVSPVGSGIIDPSCTVTAGDNKTIFYRNNLGWKLSSITVDGSSVNIYTYPNAYTFEDVQEDHVISVIYSEVSYGCMADEDCSACDELVETSPDLIVNGVTSSICESLRNDTGLNPQKGHTDSYDLDLMNQCLIGRAGDNLEAVELCDWKDFMYGLISNTYNMFKAMICTFCGVWANIHTLYSEIQQIWNYIDQIRAEMNPPADEEEPAEEEPEEELVEEPEEEPEEDLVPEEDPEAEEEPEEEAPEVEEEPEDEEEPEE